MRRLITLALFVVLIVLSSMPLAAQIEQLTHTVQPGENLYRIALRYGVTMQELATANDITNMSRIYRGQVLVIPGAEAVNPDAEETYNPLIAGTPTTHIIQRGETLNTIAAQYDITVDQLMMANNIANANRIYSGQTLTVWTAESVTEGAPAEPEALAEEFAVGPSLEEATTYIIQPGEHLSQIAQRYGLDWQTLSQVNNINNPDSIYAGQSILIPAMNESGGVADLGIITGPVIDAPAPTIVQGKQIIVDLSDSRVYAYEDGIMLYSALASMGTAATPTVIGDFTVQREVRSQTMSGPGYWLPNVEWVLYFFRGYAIHGTYWHNNFGNPMSHGCVNLPNTDAQWIYEFATVGTPVKVQA